MRKVTEERFILMQITVVHLSNQSSAIHHGLWTSGSVSVKYATSLSRNF